MWEFCLYFEEEHVKSIVKIKNRLKQIFKKNKGVVIFSREEGSLLVATSAEENVFINIYRYLYNNITNIIYEHYKWKEINELEEKLFCNKNFELIIKQTLFCFDEEFDKSIIRQKLILNNNLSLQGFYNFKLYELKAKWKKLVDLIRANSNFLSSYSVNLDLTKFLLSELSFNVEKVCLFCEGKKFFLTTTENEKLVFNKKNFSKKQSFGELIKNIIILSPKKIILCSDIRTKDFEFFKDIFADKLS